MAWGNPKPFSSTLTAAEKDLGLPGLRAVVDSARHLHLPPAVGSRRRSRSRVGLSEGLRLGGRPKFRNGCSGCPFLGQTVSQNRCLHSMRGRGTENSVASRTSSMENSQPGPRFVKVCRDTSWWAHGDSLGKRARVHYTLCESHHLWKDKHRETLAERLFLERRQRRRCRG